MLSPAEPLQLPLEYCDSCQVGTRQISMPSPGEREISEAREKGEGWERERVKRENGTILD